MMDEVETPSDSETSTIMLPTFKIILVLIYNIFVQEAEVTSWRDNSFVAKAALVTRTSSDLLDQCVTEAFLRHGPRLGQSLSLVFVYCSRTFDCVVT
jgi:hypothetical protein